jgi:multiple antibiotic resistance protein
VTAISVTALLLAFGKSFLLAIATMMPILNPPGTAPVFLSMTKGASQPTRELLAQRIARNVFLMTFICMLVGSFVLDFFGISLDIVRVGGGLLVISIAWRLLTTNESASPRAERIAENYTPEMVKRHAFYPLSFPITCGPGSLATVITVGASLSDPSLTIAAARTAGAACGLGVVALIVLLCYRFAQRLLRPLGESGTVVFLQLSAFILLCLGIQILWEGAGPLLTEAVRAGAVAATGPYGG